MNWTIFNKFWLLSVDIVCSSARFNREMFKHPVSHSVSTVIRQNKVTVGTNVIQSREAKPHNLSYSRSSRHWLWWQIIISDWYWYGRLWCWSYSSSCLQNNNICYLLVVIIWHNNCHILIDILPGGLEEMYQDYFFRQILLRLLADQADFHTFCLFLMILVNIFDRTHLPPSLHLRPRELLRVILTHQSSPWWCDPSLSLSFTAKVTIFSSENNKNVRSESTCFDLDQAELNWSVCFVCLFVS